jgi:broad specificity phosphatase PhoE
VLRNAVKKLARCALARSSFCLAGVRSAAQGIALAFRRHQPEYQLLLTEAPAPDKIIPCLHSFVEINEAMHESDRSATGFLPPNEFESAANEFFAHPDRSVRGWERAVDAQARIVRETERVLISHRGGDVLFVGHGAVGTLLFCHYSKIAIARVHDQSGGGGHYFTITKQDPRVIHPWRAMEEKPQ